MEVYGDERRTNATNEHIASNSNDANICRERSHWMPITHNKNTLTICNRPELNSNAISEFVNARRESFSVCLFNNIFMNGFLTRTLNKFLSLLLFIWISKVFLLSFACQAFQTNEIHLRRTILLWTCVMCVTCCERCAYMDRHYF